MTYRHLNQRAKQLCPTTIPVQCFIVKQPSLQLRFPACVYAFSPWPKYRPRHQECLIMSPWQKMMCANELKLANWSGSTVEVSPCSHQVHGLMGRCHFCKGGVGVWKSSAPWEPGWKQILGLIDAEWTDSPWSQVWSPILGNNAFWMLPPNSPPNNLLNYRTISSV